MTTVQTSLNVVHGAKRTVNKKCHTGVRGEKKVGGRMLRRLDIRENYKGEGLGKMNNGANLRYRDIS